jgi:hypothetical protein
MRSDLTELLRRTAAEIQVETAERATVDAIVVRAVDAVPVADSGSLTIRRGRHDHRTLAATSRAARVVDQLQLAMQEGPCVTLASTGDWIHAGTVDADERWPSWGPAAAKLGVRSLVTVPLWAASDRVGALNLYSGQANGFTDAEEINAALFSAAHAAHALVAAGVIEAPEVTVASRHVIGVAQGVLVERFGLDVDQAFAVLRRIASSEDLELSEVARQVLATGGLRW